MATWRCPHCATLQVEAPRCFLCNRSATSCGTCVNFRRSLVGGLGYCALDRRREPLTGEEQRPCWSAPVAAEDGGEWLFAGGLDPAESSPVLPRTAPPRDAGAAPPRPRVKPFGGLIELEPRAGSERSEPPPVSGS
jgi:hypothetical protein